MTTDTSGSAAGTHGAGVDDAVAALAGRSIAVLTGAGVSTASGIPDYRGPNAVPRSPMTYAEFTSSAWNRTRYWARSHVGWRFVDDAQPNEAHRAIAALELHGPATGVITQNVDALHEKAGSRQVIDLHGRNDLVVCLACGTRYTRETMDSWLTEANPGFLERFGRQDIQIAPDGDAEISGYDDFQVPACPRCGGVLKPDVIFFGEMVPKERVAEAFDLVAGSQALLVAGTSLTVHSGLRFVRRAAKDGLPIVIVNRGATRGDDLAQVVVDDDAGPVLADLARALHR